MNLKDLITTEILAGTFMEHSDLEFFDVPTNDHKELILFKRDTTNIYDFQKACMKVENFVKKMDKTYLMRLNQIKWKTSYASHIMKFEIKNNADYYFEL